MHSHNTPSVGWCSAVTQHSNRRAGGPFPNPQQRLSSPPGLKPNPAPVILKGNLVPRHQLRHHWTSASLMQNRCSPEQSEYQLPDKTLFSKIGKGIKPPNEYRRSDEKVLLILIENDRFPIGFLSHLVEFNGDFLFWSTIMKELRYLQRRGDYLLNFIGLHSHFHRILLCFYSA